MIGALRLPDRRSLTRDVVSGQRKGTVIRISEIRSRLVIAASLVWLVGATFLILSTHQGVLASSWLAEDATTDQLVTPLGCRTSQT